MFYNTLFLIFQALNSFFVVAEIPAYLRHFKAFRMISFNLAIIWTLFYAISVGDLYYIMFYKDIAEDDFVLLFQVLCLGFNMVLHVSTFIVNLGTVIKEITLEFFQFWRTVGVMK